MSNDVIAVLAPPDQPSGLHFGETLRRLRERRGRTIAQLSQRSGWSERKLTALESQRPEPNRAVIGDLVAALHLTAEDEARLYLAAGHIPNPAAPFAHLTSLLCDALALDSLPPERRQACMVALVVWPEVVEALAAALVVPEPARPTAGTGA